MTTKWRRFMALPARQRGFLAGAASVIPLVALGLRLAGLARMHRWLAPRLGDGDGRAVHSIAEVRALGDLVNSAARHGPIPATCLVRSLVLLWMLRRRGVPGQLRIGVRAAGSTLDAHAWVEYEGVPVNDRQEVGQDFAAFDDPLPPHNFRLP